MKNQYNFNNILLTVFSIAVVLGFAFGYLVNVFKIILMAGDSGITTMFALRCIGIIVAPLGALLGFF